MEHLSKNVERLFRFINEDKSKEIDEYYLFNLTKSYYEYSDDDCIYTDELYSNEDIDFIRNYSGYNYKHINNALRNIWNYEENGNIEKKETFLRDGHKLSEIITNQPTKLGNFKSYRGVNISYFNEYGIYNIEDLTKLQGHFLLDNGFVSTSIHEDKCFFKKQNELGINYNVKITYLIPDDFEDGIYLQGNMCYNEEQNEYLINRGNIAKVVNVTINSDNTAHIMALMIPKFIYDEYYASLRDSKTK